MVAAMAIQRPANSRAWVTLSQWVADTSDRLARTLLPNVYASGGLISVHRHAFMDDPLFQRAYQRGVDALGGTTGIGGSGVCISGCGRRPAPAGSTVISSSAASIMGF
jgi:hypothetical protein